MAFVHAKGIAHLDLKTTNILLTADRRSTVIADFGISQTRAGFGHAASPINPVFGGSNGSGVEMNAFPTPVSSVSLALTPHYTAPERLLRKGLTFDELLAADVYTYGMPSQLVFCDYDVCFRCT